MGGSTCGSYLVANWSATQYLIYYFTLCCEVSRIGHAIFTERERGCDVMLSGKLLANYNDVYSLPSSHLLLPCSYVRHPTSTTKNPRIKLSRIPRCEHMPINVAYALLTSSLNPLLASADDRFGLNPGPFGFPNPGLHNTNTQWRLQESLK